MFFKPTLVKMEEMGRITEIVCADSSTVIRTVDPDRIYGWGRGFSHERQLDISRFKPKELASIETQHRFLLGPVHNVPESSDLSKVSAADNLL